MYDERLSSRWNSKVLLQDYNRECDSNIVINRIHQLIDAPHYMERYNRRSTHSHASKLTGNRPVIDKDSASGTKCE
eukprot:776864-Amphidinium_carterae.1